MASVRFIECLANLITFNSKSKPTQLQPQDDLYYDIESDIESGASEPDDEFNVDHDGMGVLSGRSNSLSHMPASPPTWTGHSCSNRNLHEYDGDSTDSDSESLCDQPRPMRRRRSSITRVAWRWRLSVEDAKEICRNFESAQSSSDCDEVQNIRYVHDLDFAKERK